MSQAEDALLQELRWLKLPTPVREYLFALPRKWRFDMAWVEDRIAVEVEGGVYVAGRHSRGAGFEGDCEKYNEAALLGWLVLRVTPDQIKDGSAIMWVERALAQKGAT